MSVSPQFLAELQDRIVLSDVVGRFVQWDSKKSNPTKGDYWSPCPFHSEKTASFHADDRKGFYYCFGCHEKGDAIAFLRAQGNLSFMEAVRELADMAGMAMPSPDPKYQEKQDKNARLIAAHDAAARFFALQLSSQSGARAKDYLLSKRGLSEETLTAFSLGYAPNARAALYENLKSQGFNDAELLASGLCGKSEENGEIYDRFRSRIMFPIRNQRAQTIAFGGRALDEGAKAKYLNSPETPIFHKSRVLFNLDKARNHTNNDQEFLVAEGYMDVIALSQAGFTLAVAPMGTAITQDQLLTIWRLNPNPIFALDGDQAGKRAALKLVEMALPLLEVGKTLRFLQFEEGKDPDEILKDKGRSGFQNLMNNAISLVDFLWQNLLAQGEFETPEGRAQFDKDMRLWLGKFSDKDLHNQYFAEFRQRRTAFYESRKQLSQTTKKIIPFPSKSSSIAKSNLPYGDEYRRRLAMLLKIMLLHPDLAIEFRDAIAALPAPSAELKTLQNRFLRACEASDIAEKFSDEPFLTFSQSHIITQGLEADKEKWEKRIRQEFRGLEALARAEAEINKSLEALEIDPDDAELNENLEAAIIARDALIDAISSAVEEEISQDARAELQGFLESLDKPE